MNPNIVLLVVDTLRYDRLGISGYRPALTPNLDRLAADGLNYTSYFSNGCVTQTAFPSIFTSTLPFDYGGYDDGINGRPKSVPEIMRDAGWDTFGVTTGHPSCSFFGYDRGFREFIDAIDLYQWFRSLYKTWLREILRQWNDGELTENQTIEQVRQRYDWFLGYTERFIADLSRHGLSDGGRSSARMLRDIAAERVLLDRDPLAVCRKVIDLDQDYQFALGVPVVTKRLRRRFAFRRWLRDTLNSRVHIVSDRRAYEAPAVNRLFAKYLDGRPTDQPFFAMLHYFDLHEMKLLLSRWNGYRMRRMPAAAARAWRGRKPSQSGLLYDIGLAMVDGEVGGLVDILAARGLEKNTVLVITGDHGVVAGEPLRNIKSSEMHRMFFDEFLHVPMIVSGPGVGRRQSASLASHLDVAPTILEIAGQPKPTEFLGRGLISDASLPPPFVVSENAGNGRCDLHRKTLYFGLRTPDKLSIYEADASGVREREFYDLAIDPQARINRNGEGGHEAIRMTHRRYVEERVKSLRA